MSMSSQIPSEEPLQVTRRRDALGHPLLGPVTAACLVSSFVAYNTSSVSTLAFVVCVASGFIGLFGFWVVCIFVSLRALPSLMPLTTDTFRGDIKDFQKDGGGQAYFCVLVSQQIGGVRSEERVEEGAKGEGLVSPDRVSKAYMHYKILYFV